MKTIYVKYILFLYQPQPNNSYFSPFFLKTTTNAVDTNPEDEDRDINGVGEDISGRLTASQSSRQLRFQNDLHDLTEAFQRYRNFVLDADYYLTYRSYDVGQCLDECLTDREM